MDCNRFVRANTATAGAVISAAALLALPDPGTMQTIVRIPWIQALGIDYHLAVDGISLTMALVTGITALSAVLFSWTVTRRSNEFFFWLLMVVGGSYGVFLSTDLPETL